MSKIIEKHIINDTLNIFKQDNSSRWYARFKLRIAGDWITRPTKLQDKDEAIFEAMRIKTECDTLEKHGVAIRTKSFKDVAKIAIERMRKVPKAAKGFASMADYERILLKYHIPYFDRLSIASINYKKIEEFDEWRIKQMGKNPSQSTLKNHNAAMQRVFKIAVDEKWINESQVPQLTVAQGEENQRRYHFTRQEIDQIFKAFPKWIEAGRKQVTQDIRKLLYYYVQIALNTGLRPGKELDLLTVNDIEDKANHCIIKIRKGKTTLYTGTRHVVGHNKVQEIIADLIGWTGITELSSKIFVLPDGESTKELSRNFTALLKEIGLYDNPDGARSLYSLRHSYITFKLEEKMEIYALAKQCGNSIEMIQRFYSHVSAADFAADIVKETSQLSKLIHTYNPEIIDFGD